ncbi:hypothetical protein ILUMI_05249 [Ignelater luminosus]|uniref:DDE-1 domain-containing protein n=1 Tax=Ignelater luminosus TaxID=2038154 RepID=A0A8K0DCP5_IGNLU|nr:hypothetical protein ILUMI_05249 [Ignelater luminosus]
MGRKPKERKIGTVTAKQMSAAVDLVLKDNYFIRAAAERLNIKYVTKKRRNPDIPLAGMAPNYAVRGIFSAEQEDELGEYITKCSKMAYGISTKECRKLAFEMAIRNNIKVPDSWHVCKSAGVEWMRHFLKRRRNISIRQPAACSLSRLTSFNPYNVVSVAGTYLPPALVFPRKYFKAHMLAGAPAGSFGLANTGGWMTSDLFIQVLDHFIKFTNSCSENPTLLIYDNYESHIFLATVENARKFGVDILMLPPHCSHRMQPLDVSVFGPFKSYYNAAVDSWMLRNPGIPMTIYQVAECVSEAHPKAFTAANIIAGFKRSGIYPLNRSVDATDNTEKTDGKRSTDFVSPEAFRGFPKAASRKTNLKPRQRGKSKIITDSPEKHALIEKEKDNYIPK